MTYDGAMVMPRNAMVMSSDEMTYAEGGLSLPMSRSYLNKSYCLQIGTAYSDMSRFGCYGLSRDRIAREVYAHAFLYYGVAPIVAVVSRGAARSIVNYIISHSNPIDVGDDSSARVAVYNLIWNATF